MSTRIPRQDPDDVGCNDSANLPFDSVLAARLSRRNVLGLSVTSSAMALFSGVSLSTLAGCGGDDGDSDTTAVRALGFTAVGKTLADQVTIPQGYSLR